MKQELSILIPTYNDVCTTLAERLCQQAAAIEGLRFEILVADDGSTDVSVIEANRTINTLTNSRYIERGFNSGRAVIRNFLVEQASYCWLLFIDGDMAVEKEDFLACYLESEDTAVVYGGYTVGAGTRDNLRYHYEKAAEGQHTAVERSKRPYQDFHTSNFMVQREVMMRLPFDERFRHYGYEDVLFGKQLRQQHIKILHLDNPVSFQRFESNEKFLRKTEEGLRTLYEFREDLRGYNSLLTLVNGIHLEIVRSLIRCYHRLLAPLERRHLLGSRPNLTIFKLYKLGYYLSFTKNK